MIVEALYCGPPVPPGEIAISWRLDAVALALIAGLAWLALAPARAARLPAGRPSWQILFGAASLIAILYLSPLCALAAGLFSVRTVHHVLLVAGLAPLLALAFPARSSRSLWLTLALQTMILWAWHVPTAYAFGIVGAGPYWAMQTSLLGSAVLFWRSVLAAPPGEALVALLLGGMQMGMLGALLTFAGRPLYLIHLLGTAPFGLSALEDQQLAGLVMWVPGALPYFCAAIVIAWSGFRSKEAAS